MWMHSAASRPWIMHFYFVEFEGFANWFSYVFFFFCCCCWGKSNSPLLILWTWDHHFNIQFEQTTIVYLSRSFQFKENSLLRVCFCRSTHLDHPQLRDPPKFIRSCHDDAWRHCSEWTTKHKSAGENCPSIQFWSLRLILTLTRTNVNLLLYIIGNAFNSILTTTL